MDKHLPCPGRTEAAKARSSKYVRTFKVSVTISDKQCKVVVLVTNKLFIHSTNTSLAPSLSFGQSLSDRMLGPVAIPVRSVPLHHCFVEYKVLLFALPAVSEVI